MRRPSPRTILVLIGLLVSLGFVALALRGVHWGQMWHSLEASDYWYVIPTLAGLAGAIVIRTVRWWLLFASETRPPLPAVARALLIGYFFNNVLPARAGEVARVVALHQRAGTSRVEALATAMAERVYDVLVLLLLLFAAVPFLPHVTWLGRAIILAGALAGAIVLAIVLLAAYGEVPVRFLLRPLTRLPRVSQEWTQRATSNLVRGLASFRRPHLAFAAMLLTALSWLVLSLSAWALLTGFHLAGAFGAALLVVIATNLAQILPSSPAAVGVFEAAVILALSAYSVNRSHALSYALVLHVLYVVPFLIAGYFALHRHALDLARERALVARDVEQALNRGERTRAGAS